MGLWNSPSTPSSSSAPKPDPREAAADAELAQLLATLDTESRKNPPSTRTDRTKPEKQETAYPTSMSCLTAFDEMYYCYSLGGQFLNIYRYGELKNCSEKSADWRFCMRTRSYGPIARKAMISERYKEKAGRYKVGLSSEDVWEVRRVPVEGAFRFGGGVGGDKGEVVS